MKTNEIDNGQDVIDSRDIIERIEELDGELQTGFEEYTENGGTLNFDEWLEDEAIECLADEKQEFKVLEKLAEEASGSPDWEYGETLIRESYFTEYAEELCKDIGEIPKELPWYIANHIDWDGVAGELKADYMEVDFGGVAYFIRA
jgi:hypothetical protein